MEGVVPIREWLNDPYYCGSIATHTFPFWKEKLVEFFSDREKKNFVVTGSMRSGKTSGFAIPLILRYLYIISRFPSFPTLYGLSPNTLPKIIFFSYTQGKADSTGVKRLLREIKKIPYFMRPEFGFNANLQSKVSFNFCEVIGASQESTAIGEDMFGAILDEGNERRVRSGSEVDSANELYSEIVARSKTTFSREGHWGGFSGVLSTARSASSFTQYLMDRVRKDQDRSTLLVEAAVYDVKPQAFSKDKFRVFSGNDTIEPFILDEVPGEVVTTIASSFGQTLDTFLALNKSLIISVPENFRADYHNNIAYALTNISGLVRTSTGRFIKQKSLIAGLWDDKLRSPFLSPQQTNIGIYDPISTPEDYFDPRVAFSGYKGEKAYIHLDLSKTNDRTGACGLYFSEETARIRPLFLTAFYHNRSIEGNEIDQSKILDFLFSLTEQGMTLGYITTDTYGSEYVIQQLLLKYGKDRVGTQSVDKNSEPYLQLLTLMRKKLFSLYYHSLLEKELSELLYYPETGVIDHPHCSGYDINGPLGGSKDVADALAGASFSLSKFQRLDPLASSVKVDVDAQSPYTLDSLLEDDGFFDFSQEPSGFKSRDTLDLLPGIRSF